MIKIKTAEYVRKGHPDRVADIISDALVDEFIKQDPMSRVAINVFGCHGVITVGGEVTTKGYVNVHKVVRGLYREIGYTDNVGVNVNIVEQSPEISNLVSGSEELGAGDSGIMVGYATRETPEYLPLEVVLCKKLCDRLDQLPYLKPDGKAQVTIDGTDITTLVVSVQGEKGREKELTELLEKEFPHKDLRLVIYQNGGFDADSGLTGRKNILWYGPQIPTGGGAFAGKDPTKVDRSGAYYARKLAIDYLKNNPQEQEALVKIAFAIGGSKPLMVTINEKEQKADFTVASILKLLDLRKPVYKEASILGHFGDAKFNWEK